MANRSYRELIDQATFNQEFWTGNIQSIGTISMTMTLTGGATFQRNGKLIGFTQAAGGYTSSGNLAPIIDITGTITLEIASNQFGPVADFSYAIQQQGIGGAGGFSLFWYNSQWYLDLFDAGANRRRLTSPTASYPINSQHHLVLTSVTAGTSGVGYIDGALVTITAAGAFTPVNFGGTRPVLSAYAGNSIGQHYVIRAWQGALDSNEARILYQNYLNLTVPSKV